MVDVFAVLIGVLGLGLAAVGGLFTARDRRVGNPYLLAMVVTEVATVVQLVVAGVLIGTGQGPRETATAVGYLLLSVLLLPGALLWSVEERTRWGTAVLAAGGLVLAVVQMRVVAVWGPAGA